MELELMNTVNSTAVSVLQKHDLGDVLKPMIREIYLFETYIAGTTHLEDPSVLQQIRINDPLTLQRECNGYSQYYIQPVFEQAN